MTDRAKEWTSQHLPWITIALLALWLPPILFRLGVDVGLLAGRGYPALTDPSTVLSVTELALMVAAVPYLFDRKAAGWRLLLWSRCAVLAETVWRILIYSRLTGVLPTMLDRAVVEAIVGLLISAYVLFQIRPLYN